MNKRNFSVEMNFIWIFFLMSDLQINSLILVEMLKSYGAFEIELNSALRFGNDF